jgi:ABC-2 type transport system ATP-binding protein
MSDFSGVEEKSARPEKVNDTGPAVRTVDLTKRYTEVTAVDSLNLSVRAGEIYGFLGRNGAGKTTTIRMLLGLVRPTRGRVFIFGQDVGEGRKEAVSKVGSLVETATSYPTLTVRENLEIQRRLTGSSKAALERSIGLLGLSELADRRAGRLSLGNKQRLALARAMLHRPRLLVLDEPANALDPAGIVEIRRLLRRLADEEGVTIFVSSHILAEISQLVDRIGIIHRGRLIEEIDGKQPRAEAQSRLEVRVSDPERACVLLKETLGIGNIRRLSNGGLEIVETAVRPAAVARLLVQSGMDLDALHPIYEDLETRFLRMTGGDE